MGDAGFFKGTSSEQDSRFSNKEKKLLKSMSFPPEFNKKVDIKKVNLAVMKPWITTKVTEILGMEDEVVIDFVFSLLEQENLDPKNMQINLTGFLEAKTQTFVLELWKLLLSAQDSIGGIPGEFLEQKKEELRRKKVEEEKIMEQIRERKEKELRERNNLDGIREREKRERRVFREDRGHRDNRDRARRTSPKDGEAPHRSRRSRSDSRERRRERNRSPQKHRRDRSSSRERRRERRPNSRRSRSRSHSPNDKRQQSDKSSRRHKQSRPRSPTRVENPVTLANDPDVKVSEVDAQPGKTIPKSRWDKEN